MGLSSYRKYGKACEKIKSQIASGMVPHAYIIEGNHNIDKEGFAKAFCQALICRQAPGEGCGRCIDCRKIADENYEDLYIVRPEDTTKNKTGTNTIKDAQVEDLQADLKTKPTAGDRNMALISGADTMTLRAQTRFLKTLEEPPEGTVIMILSENSEELLPTIESRCVSIRLYDFDGAGESEGGEAAETLFSMLKKKEYFYGIKDYLDGEVKTREGAYAVLDGLESVIGREARESAGNDGFDYMRAVTLIEEARSDIKLGASYKYVLRETMVKLEESI